MRLFSVQAKAPGSICCRRLLSCHFVTSAFTGYEPHVLKMFKKNRKIKAVTSCSTHKIDQQETDG